MAALGYFGTNILSVALGGLWLGDFFGAMVAISSAFIVTTILRGAAWTRNKKLTIAGVILAAAFVLSIFATLLRIYLAKLAFEAAL